jgi:signal transduction histidine kinase
VRVEAARSTVVGNWDETRLRRILENLIGNAIKYSPQGGDIVVGLRRDEDTGAGWAVVTVRDQGIGIPAADLPHLFTRFHRGETSL